MFDFFDINKTVLLFVIAVMVFLSGSNVVKAFNSNDPESLQWAYERINIEDAWDYTTGSKDVTVAIIDNGFDHFHPDLQQNTWRNKDELAHNGIDDDGNGYVDDVWGWNFVPTDIDGNGKIEGLEKKGTNDPRPDTTNVKDVNTKSIHHGTMVAGLVGAVGNNSLASTGVNWDVSMMNLRVADNGGRGALGPIPKAIEYAVDNGADIISFSLVGAIEGEESRDKFKEAVTYAYENDVALVAAAGNKMRDLNKNPLYPICADEDLEGEKELILGVSAVDKSQRLTDFSNVGSNCIDITAPGANISSTLRYSPQDGLKKLYGGGWSGTSFAAPLVSGVSALVKNIRPNWGPEQIYDSVLSGTHRTSGQNPILYKTLFGNGLLQADKVLSSAVDSITTTFDISKLVGIYNDSDELLFSDDEDGDYVIPFLARNKSSMVSIRKSKDYQYATVSSDLEETFISVISKSKKDHKFNIDYEKDVDLEVADVLGDSDLEVVVAPNYSDSRVFSIYSLDGVKLKEYSEDKKHEGVSLSSISNLNSSKSNILASYLKDEQTEVFKFDQNLNSSTLIKLPDEEYIEIDSGDIDGDKKYEIVVANNEPNSQPLLSYYESDGTIKRKFYPYDPSYNQGFKLVVANINKDNKDEIITVPNSDSPARVWSDKVKILKEKKINQDYKFLIPLK